MTPKGRGRACSWWWAELPVAGLLIASILVIGLPALHMVVGGCWVVATIWHLGTRTRHSLKLPLNKAWHDVWSTVSAVLAALVLLFALGTLVSGVARSLGVPADTAWHGGLSWMLLAAAAGHVLVVKVVPWVQRCVRRRRRSSDRTR